MNRKELVSGLIAGVSLILMAVSAGFSYGFVFTGIVTDNVDATLNAIRESRTLYIAGLAGWLVILITDIVVSFALYFFFERVQRSISLFTAFVRLIYSAILGWAIWQLFAVVSLLPLDGANADAYAHLMRFEQIWSFGLIIFGLHLVGLGYLANRSVVVPRFLVYLLYFAGASYTIIHALKQLDPASGVLISKMEMILGLPMALGELLLAVWLIYKAFKRNETSGIDLKYTTG